MGDVRASHVCTSLCLVPCLAFVSFSGVTTTTLINSDLELICILSSSELCWNLTLFVTFCHVVHRFKGNFYLFRLKSKIIKQ